MGPSPKAASHAQREPFRSKVEALIGMEATSLALYEQALRHRSVLREGAGTHLPSNERLEFLGDAVLGLIIAEHLYSRFPDRNEGFLTRLRAHLVNGRALAGHATRLGLGPLIGMSVGMHRSGGSRNETILADALEALIGAVYLDLGQGAARTFIQEKILAGVNLQHLSLLRDNYKGLLLEYVQSLGWPQPRYRVLYEEGPEHSKLFTVNALLGDKPYGRGRARSKKKAEQEAARKTLERLRRTAPHESIPFPRSEIDEKNRS